ncbi:MAG: hypothetical protein HWE10_08670 [Gammaproteobacteria bacterium]|nr:hypothetical protein [Gammaproteobacteria bacterium]
MSATVNSSGIFTDNCFGSFPYYDYFLEDKIGNKTFPYLNVHYGNWGLEEASHHQNQIKSDYRSLYKGNDFDDILAKLKQEAGL